MIEAESEVECGIAVTGRFGIEEHRSLRSAKNVLRADIACISAMRACSTLWAMAPMRGAAPGCLFAVNRR